MDISGAAAIAGAGKPAIVLLAACAQTSGHLAVTITASGALGYEMDTKHRDHGRTHAAGHAISGVVARSARLAGRTTAWNIATAPATIPTD
jgi:molybdopterin-guanine dinucleotide biosynthesis protein